MRRIALGLLVGLALLVQTSWLRAQCASPDLLDAIPPDGATNVPFDWSTSGNLGFAPLVARYDIGAVHNGEPVVFRRAGDPVRDCGADGGSWCLAGSWDSQLLTLTARPPGGFEPGAEYEVVWPGLGSITDPSTKGDDTTVRFSVGARVDIERPSFGGLTSVRWDFQRKYDACSDTEAERYVFDVQIDEPSDDGGAELLTLRVFQTEGPTLGGVPSEVHVERYSGNRTARITRPISAGVGRVCFSALVSDPGGNVSANSASREVCTKTIRPPFFEGCAFARTTNGHPAVVGLSVLGLLALGARRRALGGVSPDG